MTVKILRALAKIWAPSSTYVSTKKHLVIFIKPNTVTINFDTNIVTQKRAGSIFEQYISTNVFYQMLYEHL